MTMIPRLSSLVAAVGLLFVAANGEQQQYQQWADTIDFAQKCLRKCADVPNAQETATVLSECIDSTVNEITGRITLDVTFEQCCQMGTHEQYEEADPYNLCAGSLQNANTILTSSLEGIKDSTTNYFQCLYTTNECTTFHQGMCVGALFGGAGQGAPNDFAVGGSSVLATMTSSATTCDDMDEFGFNACDQVQCCCQPCAPLMAGIANSVTNSLLLPAYNPNLAAASGGSCPEKTCTEFFQFGVPSPCGSGGSGDVSGFIEDIEDIAAGFRGGRRELEQQEEDEPTSTAQDIVVPALDSTLIADGNDFVNELSKECSDGMVSDIVQYNETYASDKFFVCVFKKMGQIAKKIAADQKMTEQNVQSTSSSSSTSNKFVSSTMAATTAAAIVASVFGFLLL